MATDNRSRWQKNMFGASGPYLMKGLFAAGSTAAIEVGEIISKTNTGSTIWEPIGADVNGSSNIAIAWEKIESGDLAGYYLICVPRPGDIFWFELDTAAATAFGTALKSADSDTLSTTGSNTLCVAVGDDHYPQVQGHGARGEIFDAGVSIRSKASVLVTFKASTSYYGVLQT